MGIKKFVFKKGAAIKTQAKESISERKELKAIERSARIDEAKKLKKEKREQKRKDAAKRGKAKAKGKSGGFKGTAKKLKSMSDSFAESEKKQTGKTKKEEPFSMDIGFGDNSGKKGKKGKSGKKGMDGFF